MKNLLIILSLVFCTVCAFSYVVYNNGYNKGVRDTKNEDWKCIQAWKEKQNSQAILWTATELCEKLAMQRLSSNIAYCLTEVKNCTQYDLGNQ